jgi:hypothetical protein
VLSSHSPDNLELTWVVVERVQGLSISAFAAEFVSLFNHPGTEEEAAKLVNSLLHDENLPWYITFPKAKIIGGGSPPLKK